MQSWTRLSDFTFTFHFHALEKEMATHFSVLAWRIPRTGEPGGLPSMGSHRVEHDWSDLAAKWRILSLSHKRTLAMNSLRSAWINGQRIRLGTMVISFYRQWQTMPLEAENFEKILSLFKAVIKPISPTWHSLVIFYRIFVCRFFALSFWLYFEDYLLKKMINFHLLSFPWVLFRNKNGIRKFWKRTQWQFFIFF